VLKIAYKTVTSSVCADWLQKEI